MNLEEPDIKGRLASALAKPMKEEEGDNDDEKKCLKWPNKPACQIWWGKLNGNKLVIAIYNCLIYILHTTTTTTSDNKGGRTSSPTQKM